MGCCCFVLKISPSHPHLLKSFVVSFNCNLNLIYFHAHNSHRFRDLFTVLQTSSHSHSTLRYLLHQFRIMIPCVHFIMKCRLCFSRVQLFAPMAALLKAIPFSSRFDLGSYAISIIPSCVLDGCNFCVFPQFLSLACFSFNTVTQGDWVPSEVLVTCVVETPHQKGGDELVYQLNKFWQSKKK